MADSMERNIGNEIEQKYLAYCESLGQTIKHYVLDQYNLIVYYSPDNNEIGLDSYTSRIEMLENMFDIMTNTCNCAYDNNAEMLEHKEYLVRKRIEYDNRHKGE